VRQQATALVAVHNHPSGDPTPSAADVALTVEIVAAGHLLDIELLDHLIIGQGRWLSLKRLGLGFPKGWERPLTDPVSSHALTSAPGLVAGVAALLITDPRNWRLFRLSLLLGLKLTYCVDSALFGTMMPSASSLRRA
jgi:hypothetical protein